MAKQERDMQQNSTELQPLIDGATVGDRASADLDPDLAAHHEAAASMAKSLLERQASLLRAFSGELLDTPF